jgi:formate hydrogenlyase subunit 3/multisubunit Na+/H+ antiporter MnhD subunit
VLAHAVAKSGLFFSVGLVEDAAGTGEIAKLGGGARKAPALAVATALLALSIIGLPPMLGFFAKLGVVLGALEYNLIFGIGAIVAALFTLLYLAKLYAAVFLGEEPSTEWKPIGGAMVALVILMALVSLAGGILAFLPVRFLEHGVINLVGAL